MGKTTLSLSYGLLHARRGRRVVVVTSHPLEELAVTISLAGLHERLPGAAALLYVVHIDAREVLAQKVRQQIPSGWLSDAVLSNRIYQTLVEVAPGLKEIAFLSRLFKLAQRKPEGMPDESFDLLVWDSPATGHFIQTLKAAVSFDAHLSGPFGIVGRDLMQFFSDPANVQLLAVSTLEEMAVDETSEMCARLEKELQMRPSGLVCNMVSPLLSDDSTVTDELKQAFSAKSPDELKFILGRQSIERAMYSRLIAVAKAPTVIVRRTAGWSNDLDLLLDVSDQVGKGLEG